MPPRLGTENGARYTTGGSSLESNRLFAWTMPLSPESLNAAIDWYSERGDGHVQLSFLLRVTEAELVGWLTERNDASRFKREAVWNFAQAERFKSEWQKLGSNFYPFNDVRVLIASGQCIVHAPGRIIAQFLRQCSLCDEDSPVTGLIFDEITAPPETSIDNLLAVKKYDPKENYRSVLELLSRLPQDDEFAYIDSLGINGLRDLAKNATGFGKSAFWIDSGADERHLALNHTIAKNLGFDCFGHDKHSDYCKDSGCHGSKTLSAFAAREIETWRAGMEMNRLLRIGIANRATVVMLGALDGGAFNEKCTHPQLASALEDVIHMRKSCLGSVVRRKDWNGTDLCYSGAAILRELSEYQRNDIEKLLAKLAELDVATIIPSGTRGKHLGPLTNNAFCIGSNQVDLPEGDSLVHAHETDALRLPMANYLVWQPPREQLGNYSIGIHSGSSFTSSVLSGIVFLLCEKTQKPAIQVARTLVETRRADRSVDIGAALRELSQSRRNL